ncbi:MAG TPA: hypothetical protein DCS59_06595 [Eubacterium sp.]|nr:hypothetical protein [Eubacterium sp.]
MVLDHVADHRPHAGVVIDIRKTEKSEGRLVQFQAAVLAWIVEHMYLCIRMLGLKQGDTGQKTIHDFIIPVRQEICHMVYHLSDPSLQFITALFLHPIYYNILFCSRKEGTARGAVSMRPGQSLKFGAGLILHADLLSLH